MGDEGIDRATIAEIEGATSLDAHDDEIVRETLFDIRQRRSTGQMHRRELASQVDRTA